MRSDESIQAKLRAATKAYEGDKEDQRAFFDAVIVPVAAAADMPFSFDEAQEYVSSVRELIDAQLDAVAGGESWCYVIGGTDQGGDAWACTTWDNGAGACEYVGVSLLWKD